MTNKNLLCTMAIVLFSSLIHAEIKPDTLALSKQIIPLNDGDPRPVMALAAKHGTAKGQITGKAAEIMKQRSGSDAPVFIEATKVGAVINQPGCSKVRLTYSTSKKYAATFPQQPSMEIAVCPNKAK